MGHGEWQAKRRERLSDTLFVSRMQERKKKGDGDRFDPGFFEFCKQRRQLSLIEGLEHFARSYDSFANSEAQSIRHKRRRLDGVYVIKFRSCLTTNNQNILKSFGGDERGASSPALEQRVGADSRT